MPSITIRISPPGALDPSQVQSAIRRGLQKSVLHVEGVAKDNVTPFTRTGRLRSSIKSQPVTGMTGRITAGGTNVNYAEMVEEGTRPHTIRPTNKKALRWATGGKSAAGLGRGPQGTLKGQGSFAFAKVVHHPGFKGHHYMQRALESSEGEIVRFIEAELRAAFG